MPRAGGASSNYYAWQRNEIQETLDRPPSRTMPACVLAGPLVDDDNGSGFAYRSAPDYMVRAPSRKRAK